MAIITVSRGTYAGGEFLARSLAERLGYQFLSRETIFESAAREYGVSVETLTAAMEKPPSFWEQFGSERLKYRNYVRAALCRQAVGEKLVYHGHAGHLLLAGVSHVIRVRVVADMEYRISSVTRQQKLDRKEAIDYIRRIDRERARWAHFLYGVDWNDASLYDVVLNLARMSVASACDVVIRMVDLEEFRPTMESIKRMESLALSSRVWATLARDPRTALADVEVTADDGEVTVAGAARSFEVVRAIPQVASGVEGVKGVRCEIAVGANRGAPRENGGNRLP